MLIAVDATLQHGAGNFKLPFITALLDTALFARLDTLLEAFLQPFLFQSLFNGHQYLLVCNQQGDQMFGQFSQVRGLCMFEHLNRHRFNRHLRVIYGLTPPR